MEDFLEESKPFPTEEELRAIEEWNLDEKPVSGLLELIERLWRWSDWGVRKRIGYGVLRKRKVLKFELHTGGWSGNEEIVKALMKNSVFWSQYWEKIIRGGHYYFEIPVRHLSENPVKADLPGMEENLEFLAKYSAENFFD